jgi:hypothetical protein
MCKSVYVDESVYNLCIMQSVYNLCESVYYAICLKILCIIPV